MKWLEAKRKANEKRPPKKPNKTIKQTHFSDKVGLLFLDKK